MPQISGADSALPPDEQPEIVTGRLVLRPWCSGDALQVVKAFGDPDINKTQEREITSEPEAERWIAEWHERWRAGAGAGWAISLQSDREHVIGQVALRTLYLKEGLAECSYWVGPDCRGEGVAPQATRALCTWAFDELHLHRLELVHSVRNRRSCRVALKAGFEPEGIERSLHPYWDGRHDMHLHARVKPAEARGTLWDRALLDITSHATLWTSASVMSLGVALLAAEYRPAVVLPLVMIAVVPMHRAVVFYQPRLRHQRRQKRARAQSQAADAPR
jgi:[ribosomal protein S5]-alanine N-acetyltransferase